jgi:hypothetical protein
MAGQTVVVPSRLAKPQQAAVTTPILPLVQIRTDQAKPIELAIDVDDPAAIANEVDPKQPDPANMKLAGLLRSDWQSKTNAVAKAKAEREAKSGAAAARPGDAAAKALQSAQDAEIQALAEAKAADDKARAAEEAAQRPKAKTLSLMIDHEPIEYVPPAKFSYGDKKVLLDVSSHTLPEKLMAKGTRDVPISLEFAEDRRAVAAGAKVRLMVISASGKRIAWSLGAGLAVLIFLLGWFTNLVRDVQLLSRGDQQRSLLQKILPEFTNAGRQGPPFSLARVQMALWTALISWGWLYLALVSGQRVPLSDSVLALLGIASGTVLGARIIDVGKAATARGLTKKLAPQQAQVDNLTLKAAETAGQPPVPTPAALQASQQLVAAQAAVGVMKDQIADLLAAGAEGQGFLNDILNDEAGMSIHRLQMVVWTLVLAFVFVSEVFQELRMPDLDVSLLALMGVSAGTYLGFKVPERNAVQGGQ